MKPNIHACPIDIQSSRLRLILMLAAAGIGCLSVRPALAETAWFEDAFATADGRRLEYTGARDSAAVAMANARGVGGGYTGSALARGREFDGYILFGADRGRGLIARFAMLQTTNVWRLADVPQGKILRFEMKGISTGQARRGEANEGFGLSDNAATVIHSRPAHNVIWTFYRPGLKPGEARPYVQWPGNPYSSDTSAIGVKISTNPRQPDDLAIEYDPRKGALAFLHNRKPVYVFSDPQGIEALSKTPLAAVLRIGVNNIQEIGLAGWSVKLVEAQAPSVPDVEKTKP